MLTGDAGRRRSCATVAACLALIATLAGCSPAANGWPLPVARWEVDGHAVYCAGTGFVRPAHLGGSLEDPRFVWLVLWDGSRRELAWPEGYVARFEPLLEVFKSDGTLVARAGAAVRGGCPTADKDVFYIVDPDGMLAGQ